MPKTGKLKILKTSALSLAQDDGRVGGQHLGICQAGAADRNAYLWSNRLLSNPDNTGVIEITLGPFTAEFDSDTVIAVCGAEMGFTINNVPAENWSTHRVSKGDRIRFNYASKGLRAYLSVLGGFLFGTPILSSIASVQREQLGFNDGQAMREAQELSYPLPAKGLIPNKSLAKQYIPNYGNTLELRVFPSYQNALFTDREREKLVSGIYEVDAASNRMGYRLSGQRINYEAKALLSEGIALGAVQIPPNGLPIILLNDRQTIGGYPKIGCVCREDCYSLAQRKPGDKLKFRWTSF